MTFIVWRDGVMPQGRPKNYCSTEIVFPPADLGAMVARRWRSSTPIKKLEIDKLEISCKYARD
jgi:hypothetical protein